MAVNVKLKVIGIKRFAAAMERGARLLRPEMKKNVRKAGEILIRSAQQQFRGSRTRARYAIVGGKRVARKPPRPVTSPPNVLGIFEGTYRRAITSKVKGGGAKWRVIVGPVGIKYARRHEFGTRGMPKRPVFEPAVKETTPEIVRLVGLSFKVVR